ncbi:MAG: hypothetical protein GY804_00150 [Alphaproteobacteria bacterium]|nr:hypothetical protein [Alphaproteobacteria bacterium]
MYKNKIIYFSICLLFLTQGAVAGNTDIEFSGYASLIYTKTVDDDEGDLKGAASDTDNDGEYKDLSKLGFRMDAQLSDKLSFVTQVIAYGYEDFEPKFDWAYVAYQITPNFRLDLGRVRMPFYQYSDVLDVGYAYQWIAPPNSIYNKSFIQSVDGLKLNYTTDMGDWSSDLVVYVGSSTASLDSADRETSMDIDIEDAYGMAWTVDKDWISLRTAYGHSKVSLDQPFVADLANGVLSMGDGINSIVDAINQANPTANIATVNLSSVEDDILIKNDHQNVLSVATTMDFDQVFIIAEAIGSEYDANLSIHRTRRAYLTLGGRLPHDVSLSLTYGKQKSYVNDEIYENLGDRLEPYLGATGLIGGLLDTELQVLNATVEAYTKVSQDQVIEDYTLSARWDFQPNAAFKFEYLIQDNETEDRKPEAFRFGVDLVF